MLALARPQPRDCRSFHNYVWRTQPLYEGYNDFMYFEDDFLVINGALEHDSRRGEQLFRRPDFQLDQSKSELSLEGKSIPMTYEHVR